MSEGTTLPLTVEQEARLKRVVYSLMGREETRRNTSRRKAEASRRTRAQQRASRRRNRGAA